MAIKNRRAFVDGKRVMSIQEFKHWVKRFDIDKDGRISKQELGDSVCSQGGGWFSKWKTALGLNSVDANGNGYIDDSEIHHLVKFAEKHLNVRIQRS